MTFFRFEGLYPLKLDIIFVRGGGGGGGGVCAPKTSSGGVKTYYESKQRSNGKAAGRRLVVRRFDSRSADCIGHGELTGIRTVVPQE